MGAAVSWFGLMCTSPCPVLCLPTHPLLQAMLQVAELASCSRS